MDTIVNKVAQSGIITLDPEEYLKGKNMVIFDFNDFMPEGILKEKYFRESLKNLSKEKFKNAYVRIITPPDAIIPLWAFMLVAEALKGYAVDIHFGDERNFKEKIVLDEFMKELNNGKFDDARLVVKGCGKEKFSANVYVKISSELIPRVKSLMFGEPCSTVPIYKKK
jgi:hypothetical protein